MSITTTHSKLEQVQRHGYAVYAEQEILIGWALTFNQALNFPNAHIVENVQNGARVLVDEDGTIKASI